jgi:pyridoxamine 5'-phosphate oxidase
LLHLQHNFETARDPKSQAIAILMARHGHRGLKRDSFSPAFMGISDFRREYNLAGLRRSDLDADPMVQFRKWFDQAVEARGGGALRRLFIRLYKGLLLITGTRATELNAATLATADKEGRPSARVVLLKGIDARGFIFFTNYDSRKGKELAENPHASLVFYWPDLERQVCVAGTVARIPREESETYFKTRPKGSRLAAWASRQSDIVSDRAALERQWRELQARYPGEDIPLPPFWGGYVLAPERIEFWQGRPSRLHDRFRYQRGGDNTWQVDRLAP